MLRKLTEASINFIHACRKDTAAPNLAAAFGVVLFSDRHANIKKVIEDNDYCKALNEVSGPRWLLLAARAKPGYYRTPEPRPGTLAILRLVWSEPHENAELISVLGLDSTEDLPCLFMLFPDETGAAITCKVPINEKTLDSAFDSLKSAVGAVTEAIDGVLLENLKNSEGIHAAVTLKLQSDRHWEFIKKAMPFLAWVRRNVL